MDWIKCDDALPPDGELVETRVEGLDLERVLLRYDGLWWTADFCWFVDIEPTHWRRVE